MRLVTATFLSYTESFEDDMVIGLHSIAISKLRVVTGHKVSFAAQSINLENFFYIMQVNL